MMVASSTSRKWPEIPKSWYRSKSDIINVYIRLRDEGHSDMPQIYRDIALELGYSINASKTNTFIRQVVSTYLHGA